MIASHLPLLTLALLAAPAAARSVDVDLPAGRLGDAVLALGRQTGTSIGVEDPAIWARQVPALRGRMSAEQALKKLARAANADIRPAGPQGWRIVAARPRPTVRAPQSGRPTPVLPVPTQATDIVVTASKRDTLLRNYGGQLSLVSGADLAQTGLSGTDAILSRLASVSSTYLGAGRNKLFIRGIADSSFTGPTQATVGQYLGDLRLSYNAPDPDLRLYDIASVEVLEGPQGTLYGAGSLGGIIRVTPAPPDLDDIRAAISTGASATQHGEPGGDIGGMINLPIAQGRLALRVVGYGSSDGGYIDNPLLGKNDINRTNVWGGRATLRLETDSGWSVDLGGIGQWIDGADSQYADRNGPPLSRASQIDQGFDARYLLGQIVVARDVGPLRFRSSTGYIDQRLTERYDATVPAGAPVPGAGATAVTSALPVGRLSVGEARQFVQRNATRLFATESRLWQPMTNGFGWVVGASYTDNRTRIDRAIGPPNGSSGTSAGPSTSLPAGLPTGLTSPLGALLAVTGVTNTVRELTLYGEASYAPLPGLTLNAGGRVTHARLSGQGEAVAPLILLARAGIVADRRETTVLPSASIVANVLPRLTLFARYQQGFRPGGLAIEGDFVRRFENDRVATLETGLRFGQPGIDAVDVSASISHSRWNDIQADFIDGSGLPSTANIGDGRIWTFSASGGWRPMTGLRFDLGFTYNDSRVIDPDPLVYAAAFSRMSRVPNVARYAGRIGFDYHSMVGEQTTLRLSGWARYVGRSRLGIGPVLGEAQGDYLDTALVARIGLPTMGWSLSLTNLTDAVGNRFALGTPFSIGNQQITPLRPRTVRIGFDAAF